MLHNKEVGKPLRVCVVGAGAAGICAARRVVEQLPEAKVCVFEQSNQLGGTWVFIADEAEEHHPPAVETHSSMYADLRTNIPKEIMTFSNFPIESDDFPDDQNPDESFPRHEVILSYLQRFAEPIKDLVTYNVRITSIVPEKVPLSKAASALHKESGNCEFKWRISTEQMPDKQKLDDEYFDAVFVCTGHYWCPRIPDFANKFRTTPWAHSHAYRQAKHFAAKKVAVVGANPSGVEIAHQLTEHAEKVYLINSNQSAVFGKSAFTNLEELNGSRAVDVVDDSLVLADGQKIGGLDFVLFCTGYCFNFPFFDQSQKKSSVISCDGNVVSPLIEHVAHPDYLKSLFFIGLNFLVDPFPCLDVQTHFALALLKDLVPPEASKLFTMEEAKLREQERIEEMKANQIPEKYFHKLGLDQWEYFRRLNTLSGFKSLPKVVERIYKHNFDLKRQDPLTYRNFRYQIVDDQEFRTEAPLPNPSPPCSKD